MARREFLELGRGINGFDSFLLGPHMVEAWTTVAWQDIGLWCRAFRMAQRQSFPAIDRSGMTLCFDALLVYCILSPLFLLRVLNIFTNMLYPCYAHKYILYMTLKCVHNILLREEWFPNWCMTCLTDSDFMSWYHNCGKGTMFWSCFVDDTHIHTQPYSFLYLQAIFLESLEQNSISVLLDLWNIYHVNSLFFSERMWCHISVNSELV